MPNIWRIELLRYAPLRVGSLILSGNEILGYVTAISFDECTENMSLQVENAPEAPREKI